MAQAFLSERERRNVFETTLRCIDRKLVHPHGRATDIAALRARYEGKVVSAESHEAFERDMNALLQDLGASHTGFFHERRPRASSKIAIAATFMRCCSADGERWMFQDVHPGGLASNVGIVPGDILLSVRGKDLTPPQTPTFELGERYDITIRRHNDSTARLILDVPRSGDKKRPLVVPDKVVTTSKLARDVGMIRVSMFPGTIGIDVARDLSRAVDELNTRKLIFDLRGNTGGGIGCLRLMSLLTSDRLGVGYTVGRKQMEHGYAKETLPRFDQIPASKWGILLLIARFGLSEGAVSLHTEGLGARRHRGQTFLLINEHSASATEMVAAFAKERQLATLIGTKTAGRLVGATSFKVGYGYRVALPTAAYFTWLGGTIEGQGSEPDVKVETNGSDLRTGRDFLLEAATDRLFSQ